MPMMRFTINVALLIAMAAQASCTRDAPPADAQLPAAVQAAVDSVSSVCTAAGGKPLTTQAILRGDINADGLQDHVLDAGAINCEGAAGVYGDREKEVSVFITADRSASLAFSDSTYGARIEGTGAATKLWLTLAGASCGKPPAQDFASETFCERALTWNAAAKTLAYAPLETIRPIK